MTTPINPRPRRRPAFTPAEREKIAVVLDRKVQAGGEDECWPWNGSRLPKGYGSLKFYLNGQNRTVYAHRAAFDRMHGYLPKVVRHTCDNPPCCNPRHLLGGYHVDNSRDMIERGRERHIKGSEHCRAKLTEAEVQDIRFAVGKHKDIANRFGVNKSIITRIKSGKAWRHVPGELPPANPLRNKGIFNGRAKLSPTQVEEIRHATGRQIDIAATFGVSQTTVSAIKTGRHWPNN